MGEAKRRKKLDPSFGKKPLVQGMTAIQNRLIKLKNVLYSEFVEDNALETSQGIVLPWIMLVHAANHPTKFFRTEEVASKFFNDFFLVSLDVFSKIDFTCLNVDTGEWLKKLKGVLYHVFKLAINCCSTQKEKLEVIAIFDDVNDTLFEKVSTTLEIGLAYDAKRVIFTGKSLIAWQGTDTEEKKGELMIAVKRFDFGYSFYPSSTKTILPPLSDYKTLKSKLSAFGGLKGKLLHGKSEKLVKILNLQIQDDWAFVKN